VGFLDRFFKRKLPSDHVCPCCDEKWRTFSKHPEQYPTPRLDTCTACKRQIPLGHPFGDDPEHINPTLDPVIYGVGTCFFCVPDVLSCSDAEREAARARFDTAPLGLLPPGVTIAALCTTCRRTCDLCHRWQPDNCRNNFPNTAIPPWPAEPDFCADCVAQLDTCPACKKPALKSILRPYCVSCCVTASMTLAAAHGGNWPNSDSKEVVDEITRQLDTARVEQEQREAAARAERERSAEEDARRERERERLKRAAQPVTLGAGDDGQAVQLTADVRNRHTYIIGKTGSGKSSLLRNLIMQDMAAGRGLIYLDPHGDTAQTLLGYVPRDRLDDVVYFCPTDTDCPAFNLLATDYAPDKLTRDMVSAIKMFFGDSWGPRLNQLLTNALATLLLDRVNEPHTLADLERLLLEEDYRDAIARRSPHPKLNAFWLQQFPTMAKDAVHPVLNKLSDLLMPMSPMERIFSAPENSLDLSAIMNGGKILLVNLSKGELGEAGAFLIGGLIVTAVAQAALARVRIPEAGRVDCFLYVDEFQNFIIESFQSILSEARKYHLNLTLAHQYLHQVPSNLQAAIFGNVATVVCLPISADDAGTMQREMTNTPEAPTLLDDVLNVLNTPAKQHPGWTKPQQGRDWPTRQDFLTLPPLTGFVKINTPENVQRFTISHPTTKPNPDTHAAVLTAQQRRSAEISAAEKNRPLKTAQEPRSPVDEGQGLHQLSTAFDDATADAVHSPHESDPRPKLKQFPKPPRPA